MELEANGKRILWAPSDDIKKELIKLQNTLVELTKENVRAITIRF